MPLAVERQSRCSAADLAYRIKVVSGNSRPFGQPPPGVLGNEIPTLFTVGFQVYTDLTQDLCLFERAFRKVEAAITNDILDLVT